MENKQFEIIRQKIDLIIRLLCLNILKGEKTVAKKAVFLSSCGFGTGEISKMLNADPQVISNALYVHKKEQEKKKQKKKKQEKKSISDKSEKHQSQ